MCWTDWKHRLLRTKSLLRGMIERPRRRGVVTTQELLVAITIGGLIIGGAVVASQQYYASIRDKAVAQQLAILQEAASDYVQANAGDLLQQTAAGPVTIGIETLKPLFLGDSVATSNLYGQDYVLLVRQPQAGQLRALLTSVGGRDIPPNRIGAIVQHPAAPGGIVAVFPIDPDNLRGLHGTFIEPLADWTGGAAAPDAGHIGAVSHFAGGRLVSPWLSRFEVPGLPEATTMRTNIRMNQNSLENTREVEIRTNGQSKLVSTAVFESAVVPAGAVISKPECLPGTRPAIFGTPAVGVATVTGELLSGLQVYQVDNGANWTVRLRVSSESGDYEAQPSDPQRIVIQVKCEPA